MRPHLVPSRFQPVRSGSFVLAALATLALAGPAFARYSVSPQQEANFLRMSAEMGRTQGPAAARLHELYVEAHQAMKDNDSGRYRELMRQLDAAANVLPAKDLEHLTSFASWLPQVESAGRTPGIECEVVCSGGSCSGTGSCKCNIFGNPVCIDALPALPRWAPAGLAGLLFLGGGLFRARRRRAAAAV